MTLDRRDFLQAVAAAGASFGFARGTRDATHAPGPRRPRPSASQLEWQRDELAMFLHFGVNTFTDREWGDGTESPRIFAPGALDARQWARTAKGAGFRMMILTAKHHDGFCLWPTRTTTHSVAGSPWRGGNGDVVREFVDACRAEGLRAGLYLSPWDRNHPAYGDTPRYNDIYRAQLTELLTRYGRIDEVWFDGANGEGPNGKKQEYDWQRTWALVRDLQPQAVMFSDAGPDVRWIGNERGAAGTTNWSTVDPRIVTRPGVDGPEVMRSLQNGDRDGTVWRPGETDVSIRPGWFHHAAEDAKVRTPSNLVELYFSSVGRNSKLLLNVPPTRDGLLHDADVRSLTGMRTALDSLFGEDLASHHRLRWRVTGATTAVGELDLGTTRMVGVIDLREEIARGQRVARYRVEATDGGDWHELARGTTIGYRRLERVAPTAVRRLRVTVDDAAERPEPLRVALFAGG